MKKKVSFIDKNLLKTYFSVLSVISVLMSFVLIGFNIPDQYKLISGIILFIVLFVIYIYMWIRANFSNDVTLNINNSKVRIKIGDIFEEDGLKVISFNEYFDTRVDNRIISETTLNGKYIKKRVDNVEEFDQLIDQKLNDRVISINKDRKEGKKKKYRLGTIFQHDDYLLTAFAKFDDDNRAYLYMNDYINFLINFWNEVDIIYGGRTVVIPLLGSGITRFKEYNTVLEQELLELLIWSFKVSRIKFTYPFHVRIIIHESIEYCI